LTNQIKTQSKSVLGLELSLEIGSLNNGLVEIYTNEYKTMGFHSDQALDLEPLHKTLYFLITNKYKFLITNEALLMHNL
jgi:hypothetical protein